MRRGLSACNPPLRWASPRSQDPPVSVVSSPETLGTADATSSATSSRAQGWAAWLRLISRRVQAQRRHRAYSMPETGQVPRGLAARPQARLFSLGTRGPKVGQWGTRSADGWGAAGCTGPKTIAPTPQKPADRLFKVLTTQGHSPRFPCSACCGWTLAGSSSEAQRRCQRHSGLPRSISLCFSSEWNQRGGSCLITAPGAASTGQSFAAVNQGHPTATALKERREAEDSPTAALRVEFSMRALASNEAACCCPCRITSCRG